MLRANDDEPATARPMAPPGALMLRCTIHSFDHLIKMLQCAR
jgi:hypothetical protein